MTIILWLILCGVGISTQQSSSWDLPSFNKEQLISLQEISNQEWRCLMKIDQLLGKKWKQDLEKISTNDLGKVDPIRYFSNPEKPIYNTFEEEWLMESGSTSKEIDTCVRGLVTEIIPMMTQDDINCLNSVFAFHIQEETVHEDIFKDFLRNTSRQQLPFRRFIKFPEFIEMMFQNRNPDTLTALERTVHEHAESYLTTEEDRIDPIYIIEQECEWKNARALREAPNTAAKYEEFVRQIRDSVNQQLANRVLKDWDLKMQLRDDKYSSWLEARQKMTQKIKAEVRRLRSQKKDAQWLCEYATKLAYSFSDEQAKVFMENKGYYSLLKFDSKASEVASQARGIEMVLEKTQDFRHTVLKDLVKNFQKGEMCLAAFVHLVQNHRRFDVALAFVDDHYNYPQFFCKNKNANLGVIGTRVCKCVGSFCVAHSLALLFAEEYALVQQPDGTYKVVRSGVTSRKKVQPW